MTEQDKARTEKYMHILHYMFIEWLADNKLLMDAHNECAGKDELIDNVCKLMKEEDNDHTAPDEIGGNYCSMLVCVPLEKEYEWTKIEERFRRAVNQQIIADRIDDYNKMMKEFFEPAMTTPNPFSTLHDLLAAAKELEDEEEELKELDPDAFRFMSNTSDPLSQIFYLFNI